MEPMNPKPFFEGDAGSYHKWLPSDYSLLAQSNMAAGRLLLRPGGFVVPHYSDCSKVGYVLQAELVIPGKRRRGSEIKKKGSNSGAKRGHIVVVQQQRSRFRDHFFRRNQNSSPATFLTSSFPAPSGLQGFSSEFVEKTYSLNEQQTTQFLNNQSNGLIFEFQKSQSLPKAEKQSKLVYDLGAAAVATVTESTFIGKSGLSFVLEKLDGGAVRSPVFVAEPADQVIYVVKGSGKIQIVGFSGKVDADVEMGQVILVPKYFVAGKVAGEDGLECISIITASNPLVEELAGKTSVLKALSPEVLQVLFNVTAEFEKLLR